MTDPDTQLNQVRSLVVYFSRTGRTRTVAETIAQCAQGDVQPLHDRRKRTGPIGWVLSVFDALRRGTARIDPLGVDVEDYDLVFVGTPVWADAAAPAVRAFVTTFGPRCKHRAFFATHWGPQPGRTFSEMAERADQLPAGTLSVSGREIAEDSWAPKARDFVHRVGRVASGGRQRV